SPDLGRAVLFFKALNGVVAGAIVHHHAAGSGIALLEHRVDGGADLGPAVEGGNHDGYGHHSGLSSSRAERCTSLPIWNTTTERLSRPGKCRRTVPSALAISALRACSCSPCRTR